jgi:NlpC/P60 family putative phage cell wall peptidase
MTEQEHEHRAAVVAEAESWLATPYHHQGRIKGVGVDCAMLLVEVYHAAGCVPALDPRPYPPDWHLHRSAERYLGWVLRYAREVAEPRPGDAALFRFGRCFSHGAIVAGWPRVIHAYVGQGCVRADGLQAPLIGRAVRFFSPWQHRQSVE